ncbi:hypothetical protein K2X33_10250 [bacterium]|nr:hypothetical protein [bacterium]
MPYFENMAYTPTANPTRLQWDLKRKSPKDGARFEQTAMKRVLAPEIFTRPEPLWLEIGSGSGTFFAKMARLYPEKLLIAIERAKVRATRMVDKVQRTQAPNLLGFRGNAIPAVIRDVPSERAERVYIMYPCPWPKNSQRKNRWYLHPIMPHLVRVLQTGGLIIWTSDQKFYIDEARWICEQVHGLKVLVHGEIAPNSYNDMDKFEGPRTTFEKNFLSVGLPCYELIVQKA